MGKGKQVCRRLFGFFEDRSPEGLCEDGRIRTSAAKEDAEKVRTRGPETSQGLGLDAEASFGESRFSVRGTDAKRWQATALPKGPRQPCKQADIMDCRGRHAGRV